MSASEDIHAHAQQARDAVQYQTLCVQIGHLFICFARIEGALSSMLRLHMANRMLQEKTVDQPYSWSDVEAVNIAAAVYGSMRFAAARDTIKRLMAFEDIKQSHRINIDRVFMQLGEIQTFRDKIAHQQMFQAYNDQDDFWYLSDIATTRSIRDTKFYVFHISALIAASNDLITATHLIGGVAVNRRIIVRPERYETLPTWQYKPSMLFLADQSTLRTPQSPQPQQPA